MKCTVQYNRTFRSRVPARKYHFAVSILSIITFLSAAPALLLAQSHDGSFDSACYRPQLGVTDQIDTVCGSMGGQDIGSIIKNLGTMPNGGFGNIFISNLIPTTPSPLSDILSQIETGPSFNLHHMVQSVQKYSPINGSDGFFRLGHFRDLSHLDIFVPSSWRIYWADDQGNYDSTSYTQLDIGIAKPGNQVGNYEIENYFSNYVTKLTNDSIDDIILGFVKMGPSVYDTVYLALFRGSPSLMLKDTAYEDTSLQAIPIPPFGDEQALRNTIQGDFRGVGRDDLITYDDNYNFWYFRNDLPFTLDQLKNSLLFDTLMAGWQNPNWGSPYTGSFSFSMRALPKSPGDNSADWMPVFPTVAHPDNCIFIFRGGPDFGSHLITLDSAAFEIPSPGFGPWPNILVDCGDMTGTGNRVLMTQEGGKGYFEQIFYVTGKALDPYIDMFLQPSEGEGGTASGGADTLTANADSLEDLLIGASGYYTPTDVANGDTSESGSLWLIYGSKQIPVRLNPQWAYVKSLRESSNNTGLTFAPNPAQSYSVATIVWPEAGVAEYDIQNILGAVVQSGSLRMLGGVEQQRIYFNGLTSGVYYVTIHGAGGEARTKLAIMR